MFSKLILILMFLSQLFSAKEYSDILNIPVDDPTTGPTIESQTKPNLTETPRPSQESKFNIWILLGGILATLFIICNFCCFIDSFLRCASNVETEDNTQ